MPAMIARARLVCSEEGCAAVYEAYGPIEELDALGCDCGFGLELLGWPEAAAEDGRGTGVVLMALDG